MVHPPVQHVLVNWCSVFNVVSWSSLTWPRVSQLRRWIPRGNCVCRILVCPDSLPDTKLRIADSTDGTGRDFRDPTWPVTCLLNWLVDRRKLQVHLAQTLPRQTEKNISIHYSKTALCCRCQLRLYYHISVHHHNRFTALFPGPPGWAGARRELLDFMLQGKINRDRNTDHPAGRHSIRTNQCPPHHPPHIFYRPDALPAAQPTVSKHWRWRNSIKWSHRVWISTGYVCLVLYACRQSRTGHLMSTQHDQ